MAENEKNMPETAEQAETTEQTPEKEQKPGNAVTKLYDKLPFTYRQVDIFVKVMFGLILVLIVVGIILGRN